MAVFEIHLPGSDPGLQADLAAALMGAGRVEPSRVQPKNAEIILAIISGGIQVAELLWKWFQRKRQEGAKVESVMIVTPAGRRFYLRDVDLETLRKLIRTA